MTLRHESLDCPPDDTPETEFRNQKVFRRLGEGLDDDLWERCISLFPDPPVARGRERLGDRLVFTTVLDILETGAPWKDYSAPGVSGVTCWRRFREWRANGTWRKLMLLLLNHRTRLEVREWILAVTHDPRTQ